MKIMTPAEAWDNASQIIKEYFEESNPGGYALLMKIHEGKKSKMLEMPAAVKHHHNYAGGYIVHVNEVMMAMDKFLKEGFDMGLFDHNRAMMAAYIHDFDKLERYEKLPWEAPSDKQLDYARRLGVEICEGDSKEAMTVKISNKKGERTDPIPLFKYINNEGYGFDETAKVQQMLVQYGLALPDDVLHAVTMHHGGFSLHAGGHMKISPMATLLNMADMVSSKVWAKA
jgi:hypothetical protein